MADSFPKPILPFLEGKIGELRMMRFWSKVDIRSPGECWEWKASRTDSGYGRFKLASFVGATASRVALISHKKDEGRGLCVLHTCDNPPCCNPHHLYFGTVQDNANDKVRRGRCRTGNQSGANNGSAKLDAAALTIVVSRLKKGMNNKQIADGLPVTHSMISKIRLGHFRREETAELGWIPKESSLPHKKRANAIHPTHKGTE